MEAGDPYTILFRAPTDNDYVDFGLRNSMADFITEKEEGVTVESRDSSIVAKTCIRTGKAVFECTDTYEACPAGVLVTSRLHCVKGKGDLPRFGKTFVLDTSFDNVEYYGRDGESYADMKDQAPIREVSCTVSDMTEPNIRPQESGNRMDCRWVKVSDGNVWVKFTAVDRPFELGIKPYSDRALLDMKHREDEVRTGTYVTLSAFQKGIGTGICGPATRPEYCYSANKDYELKFIISTGRNY